MTDIDENGDYNYGEIDNLSFTYNEGKLSGINENSNVERGYKSHLNSQQQVSYQHGNITQNLNAGITNVNYNFLDLPTSISYINGLTINFQYDAMGRQLSSEKISNENVVFTQYLDGMEYENNKLASIYFSEGRIIYNTKIPPTVEWSIKDHLGNTRVTYVDKNNDGNINVSENYDENEIMNSFHYYPFGLKMEGDFHQKGSQSNNYLYNGIETFSDTYNEMSFAANRMLITGIGQWLQVDPEAEATYSRTPFGAMNQNPVSFADPNGDIAWAPLAIGAALGGYSGYQIGKANGASGLGLLGYTFAGAAIGVSSGLVGGAVSTALGGAITSSVGGFIGTALGGAAGGVVSSGGFAALSGGDILQGVTTGAISGFVGGGVGMYIGGSYGAFVGGALSGGISARLNNQNVLRGALIGGVLSLGSYELSNAVSYKQYQNKGGQLSSRQFRAMSVAAQRSFSRGKEFGGWLLNNGDVEMWAPGHASGITPTRQPRNATGFFHTHPNIGPDGNGGHWVQQHSPTDITVNNTHVKLNSYVISRQNYYSQIPNGSPNLLHSSSVFNPYPYNYYWWK